MRTMRWLLAASACAICATSLALDPERRATVRPGETVQIWFGVNYGQRCSTAGPPIFKRVTEPALGEVRTEHLDHVCIPRGEQCGGNSYEGLRVWYKAGAKAGVDTFSYTIEFPHEASNPRPSKGPQPVTATVTIE